MDYSSVDVRSYLNSGETYVVGIQLFERTKEYAIVRIITDEMYDNGTNGDGMVRQMHYLNLVFSVKKIWKVFKHVLRSKGYSILDLKRTATDHWVTKAGKRYPYLHIMEPLNDIHPRKWHALYFKETITVPKNIARSIKQTGIKHRHPALTFLIKDKLQFAMYIVREGNGLTCKKRFYKDEANNLVYVNYKIKSKYIPNVLINKILINEADITSLL